MKRSVDAVVIGAGPAGLAASVALKKNGARRILIVDREEKPGGILLQCIHNGFGLHRFREELTGPEYAERYIKLTQEQNTEFLLNTCALDIIDHGPNKTVALLSEEHGLFEMDTRAVVLAMGCRERNRGNINIPGARPSGIMTAGLAQKMVNILGYLPGKEVVILGSGDIGLIMARRLTWEGAHVKAVIEIQPFPGGLNRNIVQCLNDFNIPLYLSHTITNIFGNERIEAVEISPIEQSTDPGKESRFVLTCDTLLLSVGLIPENELSLKAGISLDPVTGGPVVDSSLMTSTSGIFACGNVLHVHDLVDYVSEEAAYCGEQAANYLQEKLKKLKEIPVKCGNLVRYVLPSTVQAGSRTVLSLRPLAPAEENYLIVQSDKEILYRRKYKKVFPSTMLRILLKEVPIDAEYLEILFSVEKK